MPSCCCIARWLTPASPMKQRPRPPALQQGQRNEGPLAGRSQQQRRSTILPATPTWLATTGTDNHSVGRGTLGAALHHLAHGNSPAVVNTRGKIMQQVLDASLRPCASERRGVGGSPGREDRMARSNAGCSLEDSPRAVHTCARHLIDAGSFPQAEPARHTVFIARHLYLSTFHVSCMSLVLRSASL